MPVEDLENRGPNGIKTNNTTRGNGTHYSHPPSNYAIDESETHWTSWLIPMFVIANVIVFVIAMYINNCPKKHNQFSRFEGDCVAEFLGRFSFQPLKENPLFGPSSRTRSETNSLYLCVTITLVLLATVVRLEKLGALEWTKIVHKHQAWRLFTCIWLHAGVIHLAANMLSLVFIGIRLEQQFGFVRIGIIYILSGFCGSVLSTLFIHASISVGASGALFGLLGAMLSELITNWTLYTNKAAALLTLVVIIAINLAVGILPHVDNFAHIGGFLSGILIGFILLPRPQYGWIERRNLPTDVRLKSKYKPYQYVLWLVSLVLLIVGLTVGLVMLFRGENGNDKCHWCHYLSCVPTSRWSCDET